MNALKLIVFLFGLLVVFGFDDAEGTASEESGRVQLFQDFDTNKDGKLSRQELTAGYRELLDESNENPTEINTLVTKAFRDEDKNKDGFIQLNEF